MTCKLPRASCEIFSGRSCSHLPGVLAAGVVQLQEPLLPPDLGTSIAPFADAQKLQHETFF